MPHQMQGREQVWIPDQMLSQLTKVTPALRSSNMWAWVTRVGLCDVPREGLVLAPKRPHLVATGCRRRGGTFALDRCCHSSNGTGLTGSCSKPLGVMPARLFF